MVVVADGGTVTFDGGVLVVQGPPGAPGAQGNAGAPGGMAAFKTMSWTTSQEGLCTPGCISVAQGLFTVATLSVTFPSAGFARLEAFGTADIISSATWGGPTNTTLSIESSLGAITSQNCRLTVTESGANPIYKPFAVGRTFPVTAGVNTFYLLIQNGGAYNVEGDLTAYFTPTLLP